MCLVVTLAHKAYIERNLYEKATEANFTSVAFSNFCVSLQLTATETES